MKRLAVLGASGHGKVVAEAALCFGWDDVVFFDDRWPELQEVGTWRVSGDTRALLDAPHACDGAIVAIGSNRTRLHKQRQLEAAGLRIATIIHPAATVSPSARIGAGSVLCAGAIVNAFAAIGDAVIINSAAVVEHDCIVGHGAHLSPRSAIGGGVTVGEASWIGIGAVVRHALCVGDDVIVGAGAAVVSNIPGGATVVGVPARQLKSTRTA